MTSPFEPDAVERLGDRGAWALRRGPHGRACLLSNCATRRGPSDWRTRGGACTFPGMAPPADPTLSPYPTTRHSLVAAAGASDATAAGAAVDALVRLYWRPAYGRLRLKWQTPAGRRRGSGPGVLRRVARWRGVRGIRSSPRPLPHLPANLPGPFRGQRAHGASDGSSAEAARSTSSSTSPEAERELGPAAAARPGRLVRPRVGARPADPRGGRAPGPDPRYAAGDPIPRASRATTSFRPTTRRGRDTATSPHATTSR